MIDQNNWLVRVTKPKQCPTCGASPVASVLYGYPDFSPELERKLNEGRTTLGGCSATDDDPDWECTHCGQHIYRKKDS